jgi:hypothetical protein
MEEGSSIHNVNLVGQLLDYIGVVVEYVCYNELSFEVIVVVEKVVSNFVEVLA